MNLSATIVAADQNHVGQPAVQDTPIPQRASAFQFAMGIGEPTAREADSLYTTKQPIAACFDRNKGVTDDLAAGIDKDYFFE